MAPCYRRAFLDRRWPGFNTNLSGWGLNSVWPRWIDDPTKAAIADAVQVKHTRLHGAHNYHLLKERGIDAENNCHNFLKNENIRLQHFIKSWPKMEVSWSQPGMAIIMGWSERSCLGTYPNLPTIIIYCSQSYRLSRNQSAKATRYKTHDPYCASSVSQAASNPITAKNRGSCSWRNTLVHWS